MAGGRNRTGGSRRGRATGVPALGLLLGLGLAGCNLSGGHSSPPAPTSSTAAAGPTTTTVPSLQSSGPRTVLSPTGLNLRAQPSKSSKVLGTAAQGVALDVVGHTAQGGGWFRVKGATVTGWINGSATLSAPGKFTGFTSSVHQFAALYPEAWSVTESPASAIFRAPSGMETIVVSTAPNVAKLARGRVGYREIRSESIVACGVTSNLDTYAEDNAPQAGSSTTASTGAATQPYFAQIRLVLDAKHALAMAADLGDLSELQAVRDFANSITFPFPVCQG